MNLPFFVARRYLFSKKSHNAVNVISAISVIGIAVATMSMVCVLSGFNGFGVIIENAFSSFDPDLKITAKKGKVFDYQNDKFTKALTLPEINLISESLEENALISTGDKQIPILLKGVSQEFSSIADLNKLIIDGNSTLYSDSINHILLGVGVAINLGVRAANNSFMELYVPKRDTQVNLANPSSAFTASTVLINGVFNLNQPKYDDQMGIIPIHLAREIFQYPTQVTSLDVKLKDPETTSSVKNKIKSILGDDFMVENRYEQQKESYNMLQIEKWVSFLILSLILIIAVFNVVSSLSMLIVEKQDDIRSMINLGATHKLISRIFAFEGWLIALLGIVIGLVLGVILCLLQQHFGFLKLSGESGTYIMDAYPVKVVLSDVLTIFVIVSAISALTVLYPIHSLRKKLKNNF